MRVVRGLGDIDLEGVSAAEGALCEVGSDGGMVQSLLILPCVRSRRPLKPGERSIARFMIITTVME